MDKLPLYELKINNEAESGLQVSAIALVDSPAIERNWFAFKKDTNPMAFASIDDEEHLIVGAAMIPDLKIYRKDDNLGEYNVVFSKSTVKQIAEKFYSKGFQGNANIMHDAGQTVEGVTYFLSWIKDDEKGMVGLTGDYPDGTWFVGAKVNNDDVWAKVKNGDIKGFSVEGDFKFEETETEDEILMREIKDLFISGANIEDEILLNQISDLVNGI